MAFFVSLRAADDARARSSKRRSGGPRQNPQRYEGLLRVIDAKGKVADKRWIFMRLGAHGNSKSLLRFTEPAEVKGVTLLILNHPDRASDQWMWTPALQRERRIALQDRSTRFFGTDFSFEDLEERDVNQYDYRLLGEQALDGVPCWRIESMPSQKKISQYTRSEVWIRKDNYALAQVESFVKDALVRRLKYSDLASGAGHLDGAETGDERSPPQQPDDPVAGKAAVQPAAQGRGLHDSGASELTGASGARGATGAACASGAEGLPTEARCEGFGAKVGAARGSRVCAC